MRIIQGLISSKQKKQGATKVSPRCRVLRNFLRGKRHLQQDSEGGAAVVEFALVIPLLLLVLCGIFDFGNLYFQMDLVNEAARQGARLAAVNEEGSAAINTAIQQSYGNNLTAVVAPASPTSGSNVTVTVTSNVTIMTPLISAFFP